MRKSTLTVANGEELVADFLTRAGLELDRFDKTVMRQGRTPDFRAMAGNSLRFYCEVKTVQEDDWLRREVARVPSGTIAGGSRPDPTYNRLSTHIHSAVGQFDAVNAEVEYPNVLAFVNYDSDAGTPDLLAVLTGNAYCEGGAVWPMFSYYSQGRIREEKKRIHLYLWFDVGESEPKKFWMQSHDGHHAALCRYFRIDPASIYQLGKREAMLEGR